MCWGLYLSGEGEAGNRDELLDNLIHQCSLCSVAEPLCLPPQASTCGHTFLSPIPFGDLRALRGVQSTEILAARPISWDDVLTLLIRNST